MTCFNIDSGIAKLIIDELAKTKKIDFVIAKCIAIVTHVFIGCYQILALREHTQKQEAKNEMPDATSEKTSEVVR